MLFNNMHIKRKEESKGRHQELTQKIDRSISFKARSMSLELNNIPVALDQVVRTGSISRRDDAGSMARGGGGDSSMARGGGSLARQGSMKRSSSFGRLKISDEPASPDSPGTPKSPGGNRALLIRANSLIRSESVKRPSESGNESSSGPLRRPSDAGSSLLARANSMIRGESNLRPPSEPGTPTSGGQTSRRTRSNSFRAGNSGEPPSPTLKRMNSKTRNDQVNREEAINSLRLSESSMSGLTSFFGGEEQSTSSVTTNIKPQRRRSRSQTNEPRTPKTPVIQEETSSNFMTPLSIFDTSTQSERNDRGSFTDFFTGSSAEPKEETSIKASSKAQPKESQGNPSRLAEAKARRANSLRVDTGRGEGGQSFKQTTPVSEEEGNEDGPARGLTRKLSTLQKHQEIIAKQYKLQQEASQKNSPRSATGRSVSPATPGTSI